MNKEFFKELKSKTRELGEIVSQKALTLIISQLEKKYLETHKAESLEELGWEQDVKYKSVFNKFMNGKLVTQIELDFENNTMDFLFENIHFDNSIYFLTKPELKAILNKMEELEGV